MGCRENLKEHHDGLPRKFEEHGDGLPRKNSTIVVTDAMTRVDNNETGTVINVGEHE